MSLGNTARVEDDPFRAEGERIEQLLGELQTMAGPTTLPRIEELVQRIVGLYGEGLARLLAHGADAGLSQAELSSRVRGDELLSSLLLLHGLHPDPVTDRIQRALDSVRPYLGSHKGNVELVGVGQDGTVQLRLLGTCRGCASSQATIEQTLRRAIEEAAPEVTQIQVDAAETSPKSTGTVLVGLGVHRPGSSGRARWLPADGVASLPVGEARVVRVAGLDAFVIRLPHAMLAYRNRCSACGSGLDGSAVEDTILTCSGCRQRFDLSRAGRALVPETPQLEPMPLLVDEAGVRLAVREDGP